MRAARGWPAGRPFPQRVLTEKEGFAGVDGIFRFGRDGVAERALEVREVTAAGTTIVSPAATSLRRLRSFTSCQKRVILPPGSHLRGMWVMIPIAFGVVAGLALLQASIAAPRQDFTACLKKASSKQRRSRSPRTNIGAFAMQQCAAAGASFKAALVAFDVKNGVKRSAGGVRRRAAGRRLCRHVGGEI